MEKMETIDIKRNELNPGKAGLLGISVEGNSSYDLWLKIMKMMQFIDPHIEQQNQLYRHIEEKTGYTEFLKRAKETGTLENPYVATPDDNKIVLEFNQKIEELGKETISITMPLFTEEEVKSFKGKALEYRTAIYPFISLKENKNKTRRGNKE